MFKKNKCSKCGKGISSNYDFCPYCGNLLNSNHKKDWGVLGRSDEENQRFSGPVFGGEDMFSKMLGSAMKMLQKEMQKSGGNFIPNTNFRMMINGKEVNFNNKNSMVDKPKKKIVKKIKLPFFSSESLKRFLKFPREEPLTEVRRLSDKIIYEIDLLGVNSVQDISIVILENSIEIKAIGKEKSYFKVISVNLPIINYNFLDEKLVLEFGVK